MEHKMSKLKFSPETLAILKNFATINRSILIRPGSVLSTVSTTTSIAAMAKVAEEFETTFGINDLPRFLSTLSLFNEPELRVSTDKIVIREGTNMVQYTCSPAKTIYTLEDEKYEKLEKMIGSSKVSFELSDTVFQGISKALAILKVPEYRIAGDGKQIKIQAVDSENPTADMFETVLVDSDAEFEAVFRAENLRFLPLTYTVFYTKGVAKFMADNVSYFVTEEAKR
jgi:hypothetical protein